MAEGWKSLDKVYLDPYRVWQGVKSELKELDRKKLGDAKFIQAFARKLLEVESLLDTVNMAQWLRQEDKIPEYEDLLSQAERLEWVRAKPKLTGTPWENFKNFLTRLSEEYFEMSKTGTEGGFDKVENARKKCTYCNKPNHLEEDCLTKKRDNKQNSGDDKRACFQCGKEGHLKKDCKAPKLKSGGGDKRGASGGGNARANHNQNKHQSQPCQSDQDTFSNYLRPRDCRWCG